MNDIKTGIYRHYKKGDLYFASEVREDHDTGDLWVNYDALYPGTTRGYTRKLAFFRTKVPDANNNPVERFMLMEPLPPEKMQMLLPGAMVNVPNVNDLVFKVESLFEKDGVILVQTEEGADRKTHRTIPLMFFLMDFSVLRSAE
ncbi:MAG: DUF1653 domain-containing protein [Patescibacteria group bacterium]